MKWNECVYSKKKIFFEVNWVFYDRINSFRKKFLDDIECEFVIM